MFGRRKSSQGISKQKSFPDVIKLDCPEDTFLSQYPNEEFQTGSILIVQASDQQAVFIANQQIQQVFSAGTYTLTKKNYPFLCRLRNVFAENSNAFSCKIFFVNKRIISIPWETERTIPLVDPVTHIPTYIRCQGVYSLQITNSAEFIQALMNQSVSLDQQSIVQFLNELLIVHMLTAIAGFFPEHNLSLLDASTHMVKLSEEIQNCLQPLVMPYGMTVTRFVFNDFFFPESRFSHQKPPVIQPHNVEMPTPDENENYIFVSYAHKNKDIVIPIIRRMQQNGYSVWFDEGIDPGTEWDKYIAQKLLKCTFFIAAISNDYLNSSNCQDETHYARDLDKDRVLVYLEKTELPPELQMRHGRLQAIHKYTYQNEEDFYQKLYSTSGIEKCKKPSATVP